MASLLYCRDASARPLDVDEFTSLDQLAGAVAAQMPAPVGGQKQRIAVFPVRVMRSDVFAGFVQRLSGTGRFIVLDGDEILTALRGQEQPKEPGIDEVLQARQLDGAVTFRAYPSDNGLFISAKVFSRAQPDKPGVVTALLSLQAAQTTEVGRAVPGPSLKQERMPELPVAARYFLLRDFDGDGVQEYLFSDGRYISLFRLSGGAWQPAGEVPKGVFGALDRHVALAAADANGSGKPEIFVTLLKNNSAATVVFEFREGAYARIAEVPGFVRVLPYPGRGVLVLVQAYGEQKIFSGTPRVLKWSGAGYAAGEEFPLPDGVGLYDFVAPDFGESAPLFVSLDSRNRMRVHAGGALIWEGRERFGGAETVLVEASKDVYSTQRKVAIPGAMIALDTDKDGKDEVVVPADIGGLFGVKASGMHGLGWTGARLDSRWKIMDIGGSILDFQSLPGTGFRAAVLVQPSGGVIAKPRTRLIMIGTP